MLKYDHLPDHIRAGVQGYIERGEDVGDFLAAVICNNLRMSFGCADEVNRARLWDIVKFFWNEAPGLCWGSSEKMVAWMKHHGLQGIAGAEETAKQGPT